MKICLYTCHKGRLVMYSLSSKNIEYIYENKPFYKLGNESLIPDTMRTKGVFIYVCYDCKSWKMYWHV